MLKSIRNVEEFIETFSSDEKSIETYRNGMKNRSDRWFIRPFSFLCRFLIFLAVYSIRLFRNFFYI